MKKIASLILVSLLACSNYVTAHPDHAHFVNEEKAATIAKKTVSSLVQKDGGLGFGKLPESWAALPAEKTKVHKIGPGYYIFSTTNDAESKTLYVLLSSQNGEVYDANFTGEFKDLKQ